VFLFGDSIDRNIVYDYCEQINAKSKEWGVGKFAYKHGALIAALVCEKGNIRLGFLNVYGSHMKGPYIHNHTNCEEDLTFNLRSFQSLRC